MGKLGMRAIFWPMMLWAASAAAADAPEVHAEGWGDTPYVQTPQNVVEQMLRLARVSARDYVIDLGSGDGRIVITAAKQFGARGFGVDLDSRLVELGNANAARAGVSDRAVFYARDLYETDLSPASVVTFYLLPEVNLMLRPRLLELLKPGTRLVAHDYDLGDWEPDRSMIVPAPNKPVGRDKISKIFLWIVPAKVAGKWQVQVDLGAGAQEAELTLTQKFQAVEGTLALGGKEIKLDTARLDGERISFALAAAADEASPRREFRGRVAGASMEGVAFVSGRTAPSRWSAKKLAAAELAGSVVPASR
jgi:SAM-dependent methyltransferase